MAPTHQVRDLKAWLDRNCPIPAEEVVHGATVFHEGPTSKVDQFAICIGNDSSGCYLIHKPVGINTVGTKGWMASAGQTLEGLMAAGKAGIQSGLPPPWQQVVEVATACGLVETVNGAVYYRGGANRTETLSRAEANAKAQHKNSVLPQQALLEAWIKAPKGRDAKPGKRPTVPSLDPNAYLALLTETEKSAEDQIKVIANHLKRLMPKPLYTAADITTVIPGMESQRPIPRLFNKSKDQAIGETRKMFFLALTAPQENS